MTPEEFQKRLEDISRYEGVDYGRVQLLFEEEAKYGVATTKFQGYMALSDAFKCLFLEAVELINVVCRPKVTQPLSEFYAFYMPRIVHAFQSVCGAERAALHGYPLLAYTALRNVYDHNVLSSAAAQKLTTFYAIEGLEPGQPFDPVKAKKLRKDTEFDVRRKLTGAQSGLTIQTIDELAKWDALFDFETHGARLSMTSAMGWIKGTETLAVLPRFVARDFAIFMNRFCEISWMIHRLLPLLQPPSAELSDEWQTKWAIVDDSFRIIVQALTDDTGKKIGAAMVEFVTSKFPFSAKTTFPL